MCLNGLQKCLVLFSVLACRFWREIDEFSMQLEKSLTLRRSLGQQLLMCGNQLKQLKRTNALDDTFHIYYDGHFGTINGFRLGRLPSQPVRSMSSSIGMETAVHSRAR